VPQLTPHAEFARVTDLAAHFSVKWLSVEDHSVLFFDRNQFENFGWSL